MIKYVGNISKEGVRIMPNIKSAKKRVLITAEETKQNNMIKSRVKNAIKKYTKAIEDKDIALAESLLPETIAIIDKCCSEGVIHKNTASRKKSHIAKMLNAAKAE